MRAGAEGRADALGMAARAERARARARAAGAGGGQGGAAGVGGEGEGAAGGGGLLWEVLKAADMLQAEGLLEHCLEAFRGGLTVHTAIEHLVWAHKHGPEEARELAMAYGAKHFRAIQVIPPRGLQM